MTLYGTWLSLKHFRSSPPHLDAPFNLYPISILKPLKGADEGLRENLRSFFTLDYPDYELIFSVAHSTDPAVQIVNELISKYPNVRATFIIGDINAGPNPKVNNLIHSYKRAQHDWILISDSNVRVKRNYLKRTVAHVENGVGLITSIVLGQNGEGLGGNLETVYLNTFYARGMNVTAAFGYACAVGKSMLFRRSVADRFGGITNFAQYLAEDYMVGKAIESLGMKVVIASDPIPQHIGSYTLRSFWSRHLRWGRIRKAQAPIAFLFEPLSTSFVSGIIGAMAAKMTFSIPFSIFAGIHLLTWLICDGILMNRISSRLSLKFTWVWFVREFLALPLWAHIASGSTVKWRGKKLKILDGGLLEPA